MCSRTQPVGLSNPSWGNDRHDTLTCMRRRVAPVDRVGVDERAAVLGKRSIKASSQQQAIRMAVSMVDLTTLEGQDTSGKVAQLAAKAVCPAPTHPEIPSVAALCVYPSRVGDARRALDGSGVAVASVATGFPSGLTSMELKLEETRRAVADGAEEIDMVIPRDAYLSGDDQRVISEVEQVKEACGAAHLKVIVEADELGGYDHVRHATLLAMEGGADFVKTSTGKVGKGATPAACARASRRSTSWCWSRRRSATTGSRPTASGSAPRRCSTTC